MPASTEKQRKFFGAALAAKRGSKPISKKVAKLAKSTSEKELSKMASKNENYEFDNQIGDIYAVARPYDGCQTSDMVHKVDPMMGVQSIDPHQVHGFYPDENQAIMIAEKLYGDHVKAAQMLEEKKGKVGDKLKKAIDKLEKVRKEYVNKVKEDPKNASQHKQEIANIASQIDDLMVKLERVEKSKKEEEKEEKEDLKEAKKTNVLSPAEYQKEKKKKDFKSSDWQYDSKEQLYKRKK